jgi:heme/copper-type cytochrome/quinol oxidase subunit 2
MGFFRISLSIIILFIILICIISFRSLLLVVVWVIGLAMFISTLFDKNNAETKDEKERKKALNNMPFDFIAAIFIIFIVLLGMVYYAGPVSRRSKQAQWDYEHPGEIPFTNTAITQTIGGSE